jgi:hypothetical protein
MGKPEFGIGCLSFVLAGLLAALAVDIWRLLGLAYWDDITLFVVVCVAACIYVGLGVVMVREGLTH